MTLLSAIAAAEAEHPLPIPAIAYGIIAAIVFIFLAVVLWSYRDVSARHLDPADPDAAQHMTSTGSETHGSGHGVRH
ncbi:hypothetical protein [Gryllotalpicola ginsengisoli]|uniref:hypothetical protein n=1 Tax=Gryllotalpicola ginsengisoli TaxID=444608 RepID=UPI0003B6756B|nr:hypothetical protein [Gryllotalpicola ginsengisoli]